MNYLFYLSSFNDFFLSNPIIHEIFNTQLYIFQISSIFIQNSQFLYLTNSSIYIRSSEKIEF